MATDSNSAFYNLLFCDQPKLIAPAPGAAPTEWQTALFGLPPDPISIQKIAADVEAETRVRLFALNWLRLHGHPVPPRQLLGVVVEVGFPDGADVLAAYLDGRVRYINQSGKTAIFEGGDPPIEAKAKQLFNASNPVVQQIGPWDKARLPPPTGGKVRLSFLVSDGLYFGEGPFTLMQSDPMAGPVIQSALELLQEIIKVTT